MISVIMLSTLLVANASASTHLPNNLPPEMGVWGMNDIAMQPEGYKPFIDLLGQHSSFAFITNTLRVSKQELTWEETYKQLKETAAYAKKYGIGIVMDLDVRLAREAYMAAYPDEMQGMLRLREVGLGDSGEASYTIKSEARSDHYTGRSAKPYIPVSGQLVRVYSYVKGSAGIEPGTLKDITSECRKVSVNENEVSIAIPCSEKTHGRIACVMAQFDLLTPDVFAPHLLEYQKNLYKRYADIGLAGACKDEWGFPPTYDGCPDHNDYWFSKHHAAEYAKQTKGRDLISDCLLMYLGEKGREAERAYALNVYTEMNWKRNGEIEDAHYRFTKEIFGKNAIVATHPTWWPNPDRREFKKNGLDWWVSTRDIAQVDEVTPYPVRTALAKKWPCPLWCNMYYSSKYEDYVNELWSGALAGGMINYHPVYPYEGTPGWRMSILLKGDLMRANSRVRLLNFIAKAPVDSPVAVIFGHACASNWTGPAYDDVGLKLTNAIWNAGYYADLIPSSEIENKALRIGRDGYVWYGKQRYSAVVLYHPEFEKPSTAKFFDKASAGATSLYKMGEWTREFDGKPLSDKCTLPKSMQEFDGVDACAKAVVAQMKNAGIEPNTPATRVIGWDVNTFAPPRAGMTKMIDGLRVIVAVEKSDVGDPIQKTITIDGHPVEVDALGLAAIRLTKDGKLDALAAGNLKHLKVGDFTLDMEKPADIALWRDKHGKFHGALQDYSGELPAALAAITNDWLRIDVPLPVEGESGL